MFSSVVPAMVALTLASSSSHRYSGPTEPAYPAEHSDVARPVRRYPRGPVCSAYNSERNPNEGFWKYKTEEESGE